MLPSIYRIAHLAVSNTIHQRTISSLPQARWHITMTHYILVHLSQQQLLWYKCRFPLSLTFPSVLFGTSFLPPPKLGQYRDCWHTKPRFLKQPSGRSVSTAILFILLYNSSPLHSTLFWLSLYSTTSFILPRQYMLFHSILCYIPMLISIQSPLLPFILHCLHILPTVHCYTLIPILSV